MASTYYKYVDREVDSQVNWAEIGKSMTDMLSNEARVREEKKAALDQATRDELKVLADQPTGQSESARAMAIKYGDNASQYLRMQDQLLKSGQLKLSDYMVTRQNIVDDTDNLFSMLKGYQAAYGEKMERYKNDESQEWELASMEMVEGFGKFSQSGAFIDPASGRVSMAMMDKKMVDGKEVYTMSDKPGKTASIATVKGLMQGKWDKFNTNGALDAINTSIGTNIQTVRKFGRRNQAGEIMSITDVLASTREEAIIQKEIEEKGKQLASLAGSKDKKDIATREKLTNEINAAQEEIDISKAIFSFMDFETDAINGNFTNEWNRLSVLTNSMGTAPDDKPYEFVFSEEEQKADPVHNIYMAPSNDNNGSLVPSFTKEQEEDSLEFMRNQLRGRYDYEEKRQTVNEYQPPERRSAADRAAGEEKKLLETGLEQWNNLRAGTLAEKNAAASYIRGTNKDINTVKYKGDGNGVDIVYNDGTKTEFWFYDTAGNEKSGVDWINDGNEIFGGRISADQADKFGRGKRTIFGGEEKIMSITTNVGTGGMDYSTK
jgi:hypothetical protein